LGTGGTFVTVVHGALDYAELRRLGLEPHAVLDFSSNVNPFGPPPGVRHALAALDPAPYPDRGCFPLRHALAERHGCMPDEVLIGNGSNELIHLVARALLRPGDTVLVIEPTFGEYALAARLAGAKIISWRAGAANDFRIDCAAIGDTIRQTQPRVVWLCTPNNPTGVTLPTADLHALAAQCAANNSYLIVDRAYADLQRHDDETTALDAGYEQHVIVLHSLTKVYALAGLRLGYLLAGADLIARVAAFQPVWSVNSAAQAAGLAALRDHAFVPATLPRWWQSSDQLRAQLTNLDLQVLPSALPFMLVRTGDGARTRATLLRHGCVVRDCASFGLKEYVRVAPRTGEENMRLAEAWRLMCRHR
jgi:threonine-phosphate decarboxylase